LPDFSFAVKIRFMTVPPLPTPDDVHAAYQQDEAAVQALVQQVLMVVASLADRIQVLEDRLNKDSHNSHKPPSSDGLAKPARTRSLRRHSGKKSGGQPGHPGVTRTLADDPAETYLHEPQVCAGCGAALATAHEIHRERRQVIEVPVVQPQIIEHQASHKVCPACHTVTAGDFPADVTQPVQYGPRAKAVAVYLQTYQLLSYERTAEALDDLFGIQVSEGTLGSTQQQAYTTLVPVEQAIQSALQHAPVLHVDETGIRVMGHTAWVHVLSTAWLTYYAHHAKRGQEAIEAIGTLLHYGGRRIHDAWAPYLKLVGLYALCHAHLLRELIGLFETTGQPWLQQMITLLLHMKEAVAQASAAGQTTLSARQCAGFEAAYTRIVHAAEQANPHPPPTGKRGRPKQTPVRNLLDRFIDHRPAVLAFLHDFSVPFDNNQAERDLRMLKVKHKVSGSFRSADGADYFCRIRGYVSTLRKQGYSILDGLTSVFTGQPYMPRLEA
jgi:transposase